MPRAGGPAARAYGAETRFFLQADRFSRAGRVYAPYGRSLRHGRKRTPSAGSAAPDVNVSTAS